MNRYSKKDHIGARLIADLRKLAREGSGAAQALETSELLDLPVVIRRANAQAHRRSRAEVFLDALQDVIERRLAPPDRAKATALFALGDFAGMPMQERYERVAKLHDSRHGRWERFRKEPLDDLLTTILVALHRESTIATEVKDADRAEMLLRRPMTGGNYALAHYEVFYNFPNQPGEPREFLEIREVRACGDGVDSWQMSSYYRGKGADRSPDVTLFGPGRLEITNDTKLTQSSVPGRVHTMRVIFPHPLAAREVIRFGLARRQAVEFSDLVKPGWRDQRDITPVTPIDFARIVIRFPDGLSPSVVWYFDDLPDYLSPGAPTQANQLKIDATGSVGHSWHALLVGHSYGIAWRW